MKIFLIDGHEAYRKQIRLLIESRPDLRICGEADNTVQAIEKARELKPDLVIMEFDSPLRQGFENARMLRKRLTDIPVIILSIYRAEELLDELKARGFAAHVDKFEAADMLLSAIDAVLNGQTFFPTEC